jgi:hypothetical protein
MTSERHHLRIHIAIQNSLFSVHVTSHSKYTQWAHLNTQSRPHNNRVRRCTQRRRQSTRRTPRLGGKRSKVNVNSDDGGRRKFKKSKQQNRRLSKLFKSLRKILFPFIQIWGALTSIKEFIEQMQFYLHYLAPLLKLLSNLIM